MKEIIERLEEGNLSGDEIAKYRNYCAAWLARYNSEYGDLTAKAALWQTANRENYKSQAECERAWEALENGQRAIRLKYQIRGLEHINDALLTSQVLLQRELKDAAAL